MNKGTVHELARAAVVTDFIVKHEMLTLAHVKKKSAAPSLERAFIYQV